jgi:hypothetical protein
VVEFRSRHPLWACDDGEGGAIVPLIEEADRLTEVVVDLEERIIRAPASTLGDAVIKQRVAAATLPNVASNKLAQVAIADTIRTLEAAGG